MRSPPLYGLVVLLLLAWASAAEGRLPAAPFDLEASASEVTEGGSFTLTLIPRGQENGNVGEEPYSIYVYFLKDASTAGGYLTPSGEWVAKETVYRRLPARTRVPPLAARFDRVGPVGSYTFVVQFVKASASAASRKNYRFQPLLTTVRIRPPVGSRFQAVIVLGSLGLLTLGAWVLVMVLPHQSLTGSSAAVEAMKSAQRR